MAGHVLALAGGVGGAKLALGLARLLPPSALTIVVNTGDDDEFHGLHVSPDLDTVTYTLAGLANPETGWGRQDETYRVLEALGELVAETWFQLGDRDLATHIRRSDLLRQGRSLSAVTAELSLRLGVRHAIVPMSDERVRTVLATDAGTMSFQEYFVKQRCEPAVQSLRFEGAETARPSPGFVEAMAKATAVVLCPSNPFLSVAPILSLPGVRERLALGRSPVAVVSPIISGEAVRGPAARLFEQLQGEPASALAVARYYRGFASHFVLDERDAALKGSVEALGYAVTVAQTLMTSDEDKVGLARMVCAALGVNV